jgi:hypothetical protein
MTPFCDWLTLSTPRVVLDDTLSSLQSVMDAAQFSAADGSDVIAMFRTASGGVVRVFDYKSVAVVSASGAALHQLRDTALFGDYLQLWSGLPHRVTTMHATLDVAVDAAPVVADLYARANAGSIRLSRKSLPPGSVEQRLAKRLDGADTGTVYIGGVRAQIRACIYDKRFERMCAGSSDPGPLTRYEMRIKGRVGMTLRDAWDPSSLFYHVAAPDILPRPPTVPEWSSQEVGYTMPPRQVFTPAELMSIKLDHSADVARLLALAAECGPHGIDLLITRLRKMALSGSAKSVAVLEPVITTSLPSLVH